MTDIEKAFRNGTLDVFDIDKKNVQKLTHYLVDANTGEITRNLYEGTQIRTAMQTQAAIRYRQATEAQMSYGAFTFLFFTPLQDLGFDISLPSYTRLMYASTFLTYDGYLGDISVGGIRPFSRNRLRDKMKLTDTRFDEFWSEMVSSGIFRLETIRDEITNRNIRAIFLDDTKFRKGFIDTSVSTRRACSHSMRLAHPRELTRRLRISSRLYRGSIVSGTSLARIQRSETTTQYGISGSASSRTWSDTAGTTRNDSQRISTLFDSSGTAESRRRSFT